MKALDIERDAHRAIGFRDDGDWRRLWFELERAGREDCSATEACVERLRDLSDEEQPARFGLVAGKGSAEGAGGVVDPFFLGDGGGRELSLGEYHRVFASF
ncbi:MAG TPA: hypothetical protein VJO52_04560 [Gemmatimonadaceae bacterium]|nr:hypothetical protein [Gemmatimonadaceae bacterium]